MADVIAGISFPYRLLDSTGLDEEGVKDAQKASSFRTLRIW